MNFDVNAQKRCTDTKSEIFEYSHIQVHICQFHNLSIIIIIAITMNNQSWKYDASFIELQEHKNLLPNSQFVQQILANCSMQQKTKSITIANFFECTEEAQFVVAMAKFTTIFNINVQKMPCLGKLSKKELSYMKQYNFQSVLADTNRKQFTKFFQKSTDPMLSLSATFSNSSGLFLIIQNPQNQQQKFQIKILNFQNLIHSIVSNVKLGQGFQQLGKFLDQRYKKINTVICYQKLSNKYVSKQIIQFLLLKFQQIFYVGFENYTQSFSKQFNNKMLKILNKNILINFNKSMIVLGTSILNNEELQIICNFLKKYCQINILISKQIQNSKISKAVFKENQLCISFFGIYYNFISLRNLQNALTQVNAQQEFMKKFIKQKFDISQKQQKKTLHRKLGHYPTKIQKGTKVCCVCDGKQKKKSRFKCEKCSETYSRDIAICIDHFKEYHQNVHKYIPKGVRKGAYKNEILQFKEVNSSDKNKMEDQKNEGLQDDYKYLLEKWHGQSNKNKDSLFKLASIAPYYIFSESMNERGNQFNNDFRHPNSLTNGDHAYIKIQQSLDAKLQEKQ